MNLSKDIYNIILKHLHHSDWFSLLLLCKRSNSIIKRCEAFLAFLKKKAQSRFEHACRKGNFELVTQLVCSYVIKIGRGLPLAVEAQHVSIVNFLLLHCNEGIVMSSRIAAQNNNEEIFKMLIDTNMFNYDDGLRGAASGGHIKRMEFLIKRGATELDSALRYACRSNQIESAKYLIQRRAGDVENCYRITQDFNFKELSQYLKTLL